MMLSNPACKQQISDGLSSPLLVPNLRIGNAIKCETLFPDSRKPILATELPGTSALPIRRLGTSIEKFPYTFAPIQ